ncbi:MAG: hypothetical protein OSB39_08245 [Opitutales bacterium]|nr:hypothetical protein [Opitutales bacterium]
MKKSLVAMFVVLLLAGCGGEEEKTKVVEEDESTSFTIADLSMDMLWVKRKKDW